MNRTFIKTDLAWCAGFFDGEGSTSTCHSGRLLIEPILTVSQVERAPLDRIVAVTSLGKVYGPYPKKGKNRQPQFVWRTTNFEDSQAVLVMLWPFLSQPKRTQALKVFADVAERRARFMANPPANSKFKTHCKYQHPLSGDNLRMVGNKRKCIECNRRRGRDSRRLRMERQNRNGNLHQQINY